MIVMVIEMSVCMLLLWGIYQLLLTNTTMHRFKRIYLLLCLIIPLSIPFIQFEISQEQAFKIPSEGAVVENLLQSLDSRQAQITEPRVTTDLISTQVGQNPEHTLQESKRSANYAIWLMAIYALITTILLFRYIVSIRNILKNTKLTTHTNFHGVRVIIMDDILPPYNFLKYIFISQEDYGNEAKRDRLLMHELSHARELHSLDILFVEFLRIIFWFNPLYILFSHAIRNNHEYLADTAVVRKFTDIGTYQKLLLGFASRQFVGPKLASPSNYNLIKKRFIMMKHKTSKSAALLRLALLIPLVMGTTAFFMVETKVADTTEAINIPKPIQKEPDNDLAEPDISPIDAGIHGFAYRTNYQIVLNENSYSKGTPIDSKDQSQPGSIVIKTESGEFLETRDFDKEYLVKIISLPGKPVRVTASGTVTEIKQNDEQLGNFIRVKHNETFETLYTQLGQTNVSVNQKLTKGEAIGTTGEEGDIFNIFHYKIIENGKGVNRESYRAFAAGWSNTETDIDISMMSQHVSKDNEYKLEHNSFGKKLPDNLKYKKVTFDRKKVIFLKHSGEEVIKTSTELNDEQKRAILSIKLKPYSVITRSSIPEHIVEKWGDIKHYKIWIDGKLTDNSEMSKYSPSDFASYDNSVVLKHARNPSAFQLSLYTHDYHAQRKAKQKAAKVDWEQKTMRLLKESGLL
ncbi:MAG: peptidoglycan DD-metalloendopeptidase family protein [Roseivirga sp.]|nr:peptidoglycan DD-metalloendopeptidase family protein [Roseivirga sp.]